MLTLHILGQLLWLLYDFACSFVLYNSIFKLHAMQKVSTQIQTRVSHENQTIHSRLILLIFFFIYLPPPTMFSWWNYHRATRQSPGRRGGCKVDFRLDYVQFVWLWIEFRQSSLIIWNSHWLIYRWFLHSRIYNTITQIEVNTLISLNLFRCSLFVSGLKPCWFQRNLHTYIKSI